MNKLLNFIQKGTKNPPQSCGKTIVDVQNLLLNNFRRFILEHWKLSETISAMYFFNFMKQYLQYIF